ncbi:MAG: linear amide C-N hydrolase [Armatimonadetes bacterium]|nr:linear amide C-N hydrolase [Armatimonadota bacterium]
MHAALLGASAVVLGLTGCSPTAGSTVCEGPRIVAGSKSDFMTVRYLKVSGTNEQIGRRLAETAVAHLKFQPATRKQPDIDRDTAWFAAHWPEQAARVKGVASVFKQSGADPTVLAYDMDVAPGCSTVFYPGASVSNGHSMMSRNYDFPTATYAQLTGRTASPGARAMTADPFVLEVVPDKGYRSLYVASYDLLGGCIDGINEKGLAVALLADDNAESRHPSSGPGLNEITLTRFLLDRCASAKEARAMLQDVEFRYSFTPCHYIVGDKSGDSFVWELTPDLKERTVVDGKGLPQIVTNHRLSKFGTSGLPQGNSFDRYRKLESEIQRQGGKLSPDAVRSTNLCVAVPPSAQGAATLWHSVYDLDDLTLKVSFFLGHEDGKERRTPYLEFKLGR